MLTGSDGSRPLHEPVVGDVRGVQRPKPGEPGFGVEVAAAAASTVLTRAGETGPVTHS